MRFGELRKYISKIDRVSICMMETLEYKNFQFISQVPSSYDELYVYGIGRIQSEFPAREARDAAFMAFDGKVPDDKLDEIILAECIEIMLSEEPRDFEKE